MYCKKSVMTDFDPLQIKDLKTMNCLFRTNDLFLCFSAHKAKERPTKNTCDRYVKKRMLRMLLCLYR